MKKDRGLLLAISVSLIIGGFVTLLSYLQNMLWHKTYISAPMMALILAMIIYNFKNDMSQSFFDNINIISKKMLSWGIIIIGGTLSFTNFLGDGIKSLPLIIINITLSFIVALLIGKKLGVSDNEGILVGAGTAICGGTAIATIARIIKAKEQEIAFAMAAIFIFDTIAALTYPYIATALNMSLNQFALFAGTAINDTSSVAGAQATYIGLNNITNFNGAINVKLIRTTMLIFVALFWVLMMARKNEAVKSKFLLKVTTNTFPLFIIGFMFMAMLNTMNIFDLQFNGIALTKVFSEISKFMFSCTLAGIGFKLKFSNVVAKGSKPILLGGIVWFCVFSFTLCYIYLFKSYLG